MRRASIIYGLICVCCLYRADAQSITAKSVLLSGSAWNGSVGSMIGTREVRPLMIVNASPVPQPITFFSGADGADRIVDISATGELWVKSSISVGPSVGAASNERGRIGEIDEIDGLGLVVDMSGTSTSTGLWVADIGLSGTEHAGIILSGASNGNGTGLRIGGPQGSSLPTLATGIDITGGTGLRYNSLSIGSGTGIDVGSTSPPQIGVEASVAGPNSTGVIARANSSGMGVVGISKSAAYADPTFQSRIGVHGYSATNSNISLDSTIGVLGTADRGGIGGTLTRSFGVYGNAISAATNHSGFMVGVAGHASASAPGVSLGVGGFFRTEPNGQHLSMFAMGGDIYLGGTIAHKPLAVMSAPVELRGDNLTTTWLFNAITSGNLSLRGTLDIKSVADGVLPNGPGTMVVPPSCIVTIDGVGLITLTGLEGATPGRVVSLVVRTDGLLLMNNDLGTPPDQRFALPGGLNTMIRPDGSAVFWYDSEIQRWRVLAIAP